MTSFNNIVQEDDSVFNAMMIRVNLLECGVGWFPERGKELSLVRFITLLYANFTVVSNQDLIICIMACGSRPHCIQLVHHSGM